MIGSRLARALTAQGHHVLGVSRTPDPGTELWAYLPVDFSRVPEPSWWIPHLQGVDVVINAVGIFAEHAGQTFDVLHARAPTALFRACALVGVPLVIQVSALGSDTQAATPYHLSKRAADDALRALPLASVIVQPSLIYAPEGASASFFNRLAVLPVLVLPQGPLVQPVHIDDVINGLLALCQVPKSPLALSSRTLAFVGPRPLALPEYLAGLRHGLGRSGQAWVVQLPGRWCLALAGLAGHFPGSFVNRDTVSMLLRNNVADAASLAQLLGKPPRGVESFIAPDSAPGLYRETIFSLFRPAMNASIALVWLWTGIVSLGLYPVAGSLQLLNDFGLHGWIAIVSLYSAAVLDLALGVLTLVARGRLRRWVLAMQLVVIVGYTAMITARLPEWWLHPYGPLSKNLPMVVLIGLLLALETPSPTKASR